MPLCKTCLSVAMIAATLAVASVASADTKTLTPLTQKPLLMARPKISTLQISYSVGCVVRGTPVEFPNDIVLSNEGAFTIPVGLKVDWVVPPGAYKGSYTFAAALKPGENVMLANAMSGEAGAETPCTVTHSK